MGFIAGSTAKRATNPPATNFRVQQAVNGLPIPYVQGQTRFSGNLIWYDNFTSTSHTSQPPSGGKGGGGGGKGSSGNTTYTYAVDVVIALCEGPITDVLQAWNNKTAESLSSLGFTVFDGSYSQVGWSYLTTQPLILQEEHQVQNDGVYKVTVNFTGAPFADHGVTDGSGNAFTNNGAPSPPAGSYYSDGAGGYFFNSADALAQVIISYTAGNQVPADPAINYRGIAYVGAEQLQLGDSQQLPNFSFEVKCALHDAIPGFPDADTAAVVADYLTNDFCGAGFPAAYLGDFSSASAYSNYCRATGMVISPCITTQTAANSFLSDLAKATNSEFVWSDGKLKVVPYGDEAITANGGTYTPPAAPIYDLDADDYLPLDNAALSIGDASYSDSSPVKIVRANPSTLMNAITVEYLDRGFAYNPATVTAKDDAAITTYGLKTAQKVQAHFFCAALPASMSAALALGREWKRRQFLFSLGSWAVGLEQMDTVTLTSPSQGLNKQRVRIKEIGENDDGTFTFIAEEYAQGTASAPVYSRAKVSGSIPNLSIDPGDVNDPIIFTAPVEIATTGLEVWAALSGGANWGGAEVWISTDGATYTLQGRQIGNARMGVLSASVPAGSDPDTAHTLSVNVSESRASLLSGTQTDADELRTLCYVDGELIAYETASLTSQYHYDLTYLRRGAYGSANGAHAAGTKFARLDNGIFDIPYTKDEIGKTFWIKFRSFNIFGYGLQNLADVTPYSIVLQAPPPPSNVSGFVVKQNGGAVVFAWDQIADFALKGYDIGVAPQGTTDWSQFRILTEAGKGTEMTNASVPPGTWTFGIRARDIVDQLSPAITTQDLIVTNENEVLSDVQQAPDWLGTVSGFLEHWSGVLVPLGMKTSDQYAWEVFDQFVPDPVALATYTAPTVDTGYDDTLRVYFTDTFNLGPGQTGTPALSFALDSWLTGGTDPNVYEPWTIGPQNLRYFNGRLVYAPAAGAVAYITGFTPTADKSPTLENQLNVTIAAGGTVVNFNPRFHLPPFVQATVIGGTALYATVTGIIPTSCTVHVWNSSGVDVGGVVNLTAQGE